MKQRFPLTVLLFLIAFWAKPADTTLQHSYYFNTSFFSHSVSLPPRASNGIVGFNRLPGLSLQLGKQLGNGARKLQASQAATFAAYHQKGLHYGYELGTSLKATYWLVKHFAFDGSLGLAYLHTFEDAPLYQQENGSTTAKRDWGRSQINTRLSIGVSSPISQRCSLLANYQQILQLSFASKSGVFFIPHTRVSLGLSYNFNY